MLVFCERSKCTWIQTASYFNRQNEHDLRCHLLNEWMNEWMNDQMNKWMNDTSQNSILKVAYCWLTFSRNIQYFSHKTILIDTWGNRINHFWDISGLWRINKQNLFRAEGINLHRVCYNMYSVYNILLILNYVRFNSSGLDLLKTVLFVYIVSFNFCPTFNFGRT